MDLQVDRTAFDDLSQAADYEWLVTNGLGGFASGTVAEANTRRYHGLLVAALTPPTGRVLLVAKLDISARYQGREYPLFSNEFGDGVVDPEGFRWLDAFYLENGLPVWRYRFADVLLEKRLLMKPLANTTLLRLTLLEGSATVTLTATPLCNDRDYHGQTQGGWSITQRAIVNGVEIQARPESVRYRITCDQGAFTPDPAWYWGFHYRKEHERGLSDSEDLYRPGVFQLTLAPEQAAVFSFSDEPVDGDDFAHLQSQVMARQNAVVSGLAENKPGWLKQLARAADQFIVQRWRDGLPEGKTVIAGYPWFTDWGRDTMIALPGLTLALGRYDIAREILKTFAMHLSQGMLPNRFPDDDRPPEYNTVDATLWLFHALDQYRRYSGDWTFPVELYPALRDIIDWHVKGTRYGIHLDDDGLLSAGEPGAQLTWMDAKVGDWVVTPRIGKCVEINALWYQALAVMAELAGQMNDSDNADQYRRQAEHTRTGFQRFWNETNACLYDVIDGPEGALQADARRYDASIRPNQIFALSLPHSPLSKDRQQPVFDTVTRELLTPYGLRTLAQKDDRYRGIYLGDPHQRDGAYHQGTVWPWLMGPYLDAHLKRFGDKQQALSLLSPLLDHLGGACLGEVSEIFDGDPPHSPRGCFAQAWSVAELLRIGRILTN